MNALKHGLRARNFGILPEESHAEWAEHVADLRRGYDPVDDVEEKLVTAIAVAMWHEIRADRTLVETMAEIPPCRPGRSHGSDLQEPAHARSLGTAIRYMTAAGMATQRAQRAFFQHRKAKRDGLLLPAVETAEPPANQNDTNEFILGNRDAQANAAMAPAAEKCTNEFALPVAAAHAPSTTESPPATAPGGAGPPGASGLIGVAWRRMRHDACIRVRFALGWPHEPPLPARRLRRHAGRGRDRRIHADGDPGSPVRCDGRGRACR